MSHSLWIYTTYFRYTSEKLAGLAPNSTQQNPSSNFGSFITHEDIQRNTE